MRRTILSKFEIIQEERSRQQTSDISIKIADAFWRYTGIKKKGKSTPICKSLIFFNYKYTIYFWKNRQCLQRELLSFNKQISVKYLKLTSRVHISPFHYYKTNL